MEVVIWFWFCELSLSANFRPSQYITDIFQTPSRRLPDTFRHLPDTFQTPSRHRPDTFLTFSRQSSVNLQTPSIHPQGTQASEWSKKIYMVRWAAGAAATYIGAAATYMLELQPHILELQPHISSFRKYNHFVAPSCKLELARFSA